MADSDFDVSSQLDPDDVDSSDDETEVQDQPQKGKRKKRKKPQQQRPRKRCPGGLQEVGSEGELRSLGKYGVGMLQKCKDCGGGPHQASMQVPDTQLKEFLASTLQLEGTELEQKIKSFLGDLNVSQHLQKNLKHSMLQGVWYMKLQPYQLALQVGYAVFGKKLPYDDDLFKQLAQDFFHMVAPPEGIAKAADLPSSDTAGRPVWWDKLKPDADPGKVHSEAVASTSSTLKDWYEKHKMWTFFGPTPPTGVQQQQGARRRKVYRRQSKGSSEAAAAAAAADEEPPDDSEPTFAAFTAEYGPKEYIAAAASQHLNLMPHMARFEDKDWAVAIRAALAVDSHGYVGVKKLMAAVKAVGETANPAHVLPRVWESTFGSSGSSAGGGSAAAQARPAGLAGSGLAGRRPTNPDQSLTEQDEAVPAEAVHPGGAGDTLTPSNTYWQAVEEHLEAQRPLDGLPALPDGEALGIVLRAAAIVLNCPIHLARLDQPVPDLMVYAATPGAFRVHQEQPDGAIKDRQKQGFEGLGFRLVLGQDLLPSTLQTGLLLLHSADGLVAFRRDCVLEQRTCSDLDKFPGVGQFSISPVTRRRTTAAGQGNAQKDAKDLLALLDNAAALVAQGKADYVRGSPFVLDESDYVKPGLLDVLDEVSQGAKLVSDGMTAWGAAQRVLLALKVNPDTPDGGHFASIIMPLLAMKPPDLRTQVAAAVLEHVDLGDTPWVFDYGIYANASAHGSAPACDRLVGAQPDGTWRAVSPVQFRRICAAVVASIQQGQYDECAGRMLLRALGLNVDRVEAGADLRMSAATEQTLQQRLSIVARDVTQAKQHTTMEGYLPIVQRALAFWWQRQHAAAAAATAAAELQQSQEQQQQDQQPQTQQQAQQQEGQELQYEEEEEVQQDAVNSQQHQLESLLVTVNGFNSLIASVEQQPSSIREAFSSVFGSSISNAGSSQGQQRVRLSVDAIPEVQAAREQLLGAGSECSSHHGQLSLGYWKKHVFALTWLQDKQYELTYGSIKPEERLSQAPPIETEEQVRTKSEMKRREAMKIPKASMRPRPELATIAVQLLLLRSALSGVQNTRDLVRIIGMLARHLMCYVSLNRGNEVRQTAMGDMSMVDYPTTARSTIDVFSACDSSRAMSCIAFTNTHGKSNPGDRVDMDVVGRHRIPLLDATFWLMLQMVANFHVIGTYEATLDSTGEVVILQGMAAPNFEGQEWKTLYVFYEGNPHTPISSETVLEHVSQAFLQAGIDAEKKQHFGRKYKVVFVRAMYGTPLPELDLIAHWSQDVKQQHYAQLPARDPVAQLLDFPTAMQYYLERADLDPGAIQEFQPMVNSILPWLGVKLARAEQVLHATAASRRDRTAVDALRALVRIRVWFWQTLPFVVEEFPILPCWDWPVFKTARETGAWDRWCKVQITYCRGAQRAAEVLNSPMYSIRSGAGPEAITAQLKSIMGSFKGYLMGTTQSPETDASVRMVQNVLGGDLKELLQDLRHATGQQPGGRGAQQEQPGGPQDDVQLPDAAQQDANPAAADNPQQQQQQQGQEQQWSWPPTEPLQAQWDAAAHGSSTGCYAIPEDWNTDGLLEHSMQLGEQYIQWRQQDGNWPRMLDSSSGSGDQADLQGFNSYAAGMQLHGPEFAGLLLGLQSQVQRLQLTVQAVQASVNHVGMGVNTVLQQQQHMSGQQLLTVELQHKALHGIDGLMASHVSLHESMQDVRQQLSAVQQDVLAAATSQAQPGASSKAGQLSKKRKQRTAETVADSRAAGSSAMATAPGATAAAAAAGYTPNTTEVGAQVVYTAWPGAADKLSGLIAGRGADAQGITHLVEEWTQGVIIMGGAVDARTRPVKQLEGVPGQWRNKDRMRKVVMYRKAIWLAYERRVQGHPLKQPGGADSGTASAAAGSGAPTMSDAALGADSAAAALDAAAGAGSAAAALDAAAGADSAAAALGAAAGAGSAAAGADSAAAALGAAAGAGSAAAGADSAAAALGAAAGAGSAAAGADSAAAALDAAAGADSAAAALGAAAGAGSAAAGADSAAAGADSAAAGADSAAAALGAAAGAGSAAAGVGSGSAASSSCSVMTKEEAINDLEVLARLLSKDASANISAEQRDSYLRDPAARKGMVQALIQYTAARNGLDAAAGNGPDNALKGITPNYQELSVWLQKNEWPTNVYSEQYNEAIYEFS